MLAVLLAAVPAAPQGQAVIPLGGQNLAQVEGDTLVSCPSRYAPSRAMFVYARSVMPAGAVALRSFRLRSDGGRVYTGGHVHQIQVQMSNPPRSPAAGFSMGWAANHGADLAVVVQKASILFPAPTCAAPEGFHISFPLDKPFTYTGAAFAVDFLTSGASLVSAAYYLDAVTTPGAVPPPAGKRVYTGTSCPSGLECKAEPLAPGGILLYEGRTRVPLKSTPVVVIFGLSDKRLGFIPLPLELSFLGAPGCRLYTDTVALACGFADAASPEGAFALKLGFLPAEPVLAGLAVFDQALCLDRSYNAAGAGLSALARNTLGGVLFKGSCDCLHLYSCAQTGSHLWTGQEPAARFHEGKALVMELNW